MTRTTRTGGFTLLEVMLATVILAVGTTSVLVVFATAAGMASQRQVNLRREQVLDEARHHAQALVDAWRPAKASAPAAAPKGSKKTDTTAASAAYAPSKVEGKKSDRYDGFVYDLTFEPRDRAVPEKGFDVAMVVRYGGGELSATATTTLMQTLIADDEFNSSTTWDEERKGLANSSKARESR
jgi:prepilin-type N-terminal cleavage/methylation domain-containing protein